MWISEIESELVYGLSIFHIVWTTSLNNRWIERLNAINAHHILKEGEMIFWGKTEKVNTILILKKGITSLPEEDF